MIPPILRLSVDLWSSITPLLNFEDVNALLLLGNPHVAKALASSVREFEFNKPLHTVDFESIFATAKATPELQSIVINRNLGIYRLLNPLVPLQPEQFPPKLTSLRVEAQHSLDFFLVSHDISQLAPGLLSLRLCGSSSSLRGMDDFKFPSKLQRLELSGTFLYLGEGGLASLPPTITHLDIVTDSVPEMTHNEWPPQLSTLHLHELYENVVIEHLPRTLADLSLNFSDGKPTSSFKPTTTETFAFPWRVFFPSLTSLSFNLSLRGGSLMTLVKSMVASDAYDASEVATFLSSGFWHSPQLDVPPATGYPLFERIFFITASFDMLEVVRTLAPYLRNVQTICRLPFEAYKYLPSVTVCSNAVTPLTLSAGMPTQLKSVRLQSVELSAMERMTSLDTVCCDDFGAQPLDEASLNGVRLPSSLKTFSMGATLTSPLLRLLPSTLVTLKALIRTRAEWSVIATHLVCLRNLSLNLHFDSWYGTDALTPMASTCLESFTLDYRRESSYPPSELLAHEFFGTTSPLPPSLTVLSIASHNPRYLHPFEIIPFLPRQLCHLDIKLSSSQPHPSFNAALSRTPEELLACLPEGLDSLELSLARSATDVPFSTSLLAFLPRGLKTFETAHLFTRARDEAIIGQILESLPSKLTQLRYDLQRDLSDAYFERIRPYLYSGAERPPSSSD